jgi:hypothetical protein
MAMICSEYIFNDSVPSFEAIRDKLVVIDNKPVEFSTSEFCFDLKSMTGDSPETYNVLSHQFQYSGPQYIRDAHYRSSRFDIEIRLAGKILEVRYLGRARDWCRYVNEMAAAFGGTLVEDPPEVRQRIRRQLWIQAAFGWMILIGAIGVFSLLYIYGNSAWAWASYFFISVALIGSTVWRIKRVLKKLSETPYAAAQTIPSVTTSDPATDTAPPR